MGGVSIGWRVASIDGKSVPDDVDVVAKRLRDAERLRDAPALSEDQRAKLARVPALEAEAAEIRATLANAENAAA
jgi:hypothetical protein